MTGLLEDLRLALRTLLRARRFAITATITLALVLGTNAAIFTLCYGVLIRPINVPELDRLVFANLTEGRSRGFAVPAGTYEDWRTQVRQLSALSGYVPSIAYIGGQDGSIPERVTGADVAPGFFDVVGGRAVLGRTFNRDEVGGKTETVVVLSDGLWKRRFAADPGVIGKSLLIGEVKFKVIGVMPADFAFPLKTDLWYPIANDPAAKSERFEGSMRVFGRLAVGASLESAEAELRSIHARLQRLHPKMDQKARPDLAPLRQLDLSGAHNILETVLAASYFLLLIGCANLATQLLARALNRRKEIGTRISLGASRARIIRQLLTESLLLSFVGAGLGVGVASWLVSTSKYLFTALEFVPGFRNAALNIPTFIYLALVAFGTGVLFGLAPALQLARTDLNEVLKESGRGYSGTRRTRRLRDGLIVAQVAMAVLVAFGAVTFSTLLNRVMRDKGFTTEGIVSASIQLSQQRFSKLSQQAQFTDELMRKLRAVPGVQTVAVVSPEPYARDSSRDSFTIEGQHDTTGRGRRAYRRVVSSDMGSVLNIPLIRGRMLTEADRWGAPLVAVVSRAFVTSYFPAGDPLGRRITFGPVTPKSHWATIVGVIEDVEQHPGRGMQPTVYLSRLQWLTRSLTFLMRTSPGRDVVPDARRLFQDAGRGVYLVRAGSLNDLVADRMTGYRLMSHLSVLFGVMALLIAAVGLNGATNFLVAERTNEIGVRAAIGASPAGLLRFVLRKGMVLTGLGLAIGLAGAVPTGRYLEMAFYSFGALSPLVMSAAAAAVLLVTVAGSLIPGLRASRLDPVAALRYE